MKTYYYILALSVSFFCVYNVVSQTHASINFSNQDIDHDLDFITSPQGRTIVVAKKTYEQYTDGIFKDGYGREALFRGWNTSGAVKLVSMKFKPFKNAKDAAICFSTMKQQMGANQIRFTIAWEGVHIAPDVIDYVYLDAIILQLKEAIKLGMYVVIDYHSDLYSRHTFTTTSKNTGNGAPKWVVKGGDYGTDDCGLPCLFTWSAHKLSDNAVRRATRAFWLNSPITTSKGKRFVQDEFLWQLGKVASYLNQKLSAEEKDYILGIEPLNEPFDGGIKELGIKDYSDFDNLILWPFYKRVRQAMNANGFANKLVYAEPLVFWYTTTGVLAPATGGGYLKEKPGKGFVFAPHMYDQARMGVGEIKPAKNGEYLSKLDEAREEARFLGSLPLFLGEYGMWNDGKWVKDNIRISNASIQALETSKTTHKGTQYADFYTPWIHGTQWHWNHYYDKSSEFLNGNSKKVVTEDDAWNKENFSIVKDYSKVYNQDKHLVERSYPRRTQGHLMHFAYNALPKDNSGKILKWYSVRLNNKEYFKNRKFSLTVWKGRRAEAPSEVYIPRSFIPSKTTVITESKIIRGLTLQNTVTNTANEVLLMKDVSSVNKSGYRLFVWDDLDKEEKAATSNHFCLVVEHTENSDEQHLKKIQLALKQRIVKEEKSAIYLPKR